MSSTATVGGAVAFGAQTAVRDVIAGFFVLVEDQFGVGDEVDLGLATGCVERISLRTFSLRDDEGRIWHAPHGNVQRVANLSTASLAVLDLEVDRAMPRVRLAVLDLEVDRAMPRVRLAVLAEELRAGLAVNPRPPHCRPSHRAPSASAPSATTRRAQPRCRAPSPSPPGEV